MGLRQRQWAKKQRLALRRFLGMCCKSCGNRYYSKLEFDVIKSVGNQHHRKMEWSWRMSFYRKMYKQNNLQLLCPKCHNIKTYKENYETPPLN